MKKVLIAASLAFAFALLGGGEGAFANYPADCTVANETELRAAADDAENCPVIDIVAAPGDFGIQLSSDFDGNGKTLRVMGDDTVTKYGLLIDSYGMSGQTPSPSTINVGNFNIEGDNKYFFNILNSATPAVAGMSVTLHDIVSTQTTDGWKAHINVKDIANLNLENYKALDSNLAIDYSPKIASNDLVVTLNGYSSTAACGVNYITSYAANTTLEILPATVAGLEQIGGIALNDTVMTTEELIESGYLVDNIPPSVTVDYSTTAWTKNGVSVTLTLSKPIGAIDGWTSNEDGTVWTKTYSANTSETVWYFTDSHGDKYGIGVAVNNIDATAPTIDSVTTNPAADVPAEDVEITVDATDEESGIAEYSFDGGKTWQTSNTYKATSNGTYSVLARNMAGEVSEVKIVMINNIKPEEEIETTELTTPSTGVATATWNNNSLQATTVLITSVLLIGLIVFYSRTQKLESSK